MKVRTTEDGLETSAGIPIPVGSILTPPLNGRAPRNGRAEKQRREREKLDLLRMMQLGRAEPVDNEAKAAYEKWLAKQATAFVRGRAAAMITEKQQRKQQAIAKAERLARFEQSLKSGSLPTKSDREPEPPGQIVTITPGEATSLLADAQLEEDEDDEQTVDAE